MDTETLFTRVLAHFDGSPAKLAKALDESTPVVCNWKSRGIPASRAKAIQALTGIPVQQIRPNDWRDYWPDAEQAETAKAG